VPLASGAGSRPSLRLRRRSSTTGNPEPRRVPESLAPRGLNGSRGLFPVGRDVCSPHGRRRTKCWGQPVLFGEPTVDHLYSDYFLNLAQVAIGFVGFSTIAVVLREMIGTPLDRYQTLIVRFVVECGLGATIYALGGVLLAMIGLTPPLQWRIASAALGVFGLAYPLHYLYRRRRLKPKA